jgi:hypothetical protein
VSLTIRDVIHWRVTLKVSSVLVVPETGSVATMEKEWIAGVPRLVYSTFRIPELMLNADGRVLYPSISTFKPNLIPVHD